MFRPPFRCSSAARRSPQPKLEEPAAASLEDGPRGVLIPHRPEPPAPLASGVLDGLDAAAVAALARAGVTTLEELTKVEEVELVRASGLPLTRLLRFRFLARRLASTPQGADVAPASMPGADSLERFSPSEHGSSGGHIEDPPVGGPFA